MPGWIECDNKHRANIRLHDAAIAISQACSIGVCRKCRQPLHYLIEHTFANDEHGARYRYEVVRAVRLGTRLENEGYDPFLLVLRNNEGETVWPQFWAPGKKGESLYGQFSPLLTIGEWNRLFTMLDQNSSAPHI